MFSTGIKSVNGAIRRICDAESPAEFERAIGDIHVFLKEMEVDAECLMELQRRGYFLKNEYSEKATVENMQQAKKRVIEYIEEFMEAKKSDVILYQVLDKFDLFLEALLEQPPHKSAGINMEQLSAIKIKNEYDVQHFLYAYLKPLYPLLRLEVTEDAGYRSVRPDIVVDSQTVIEVKCTARQGMTEKKLMEEVAADITNYSAQNIYFFIYDMEKILREPEVFKNTYEQKIKDKNIFIIIHQSKKI